MKAVVVVVLSWNKQGAVLDSIARIKELNGNVHVVVVDNASSDDSVAAIRRAHPDVTLLQEAVNVGFAGGVNRGLAEAERRGADYAWLLNDDTMFEGDVLDALLAFAEKHTSAGLLSPLLLDLTPEAREQFRNGIVDWEAGTMRHNVPVPDFGRRVRAGATVILPGTALFVPMRVYRTIGPFDERFFAYWEDTDYAIRAARAGFASDVVCASTVAHAAPATTDRAPHYHYYMTRNEALFWREHAPAARRTPWTRRWLSSALDSIGRERDLGHFDNAHAVVDGLWHAWTRRYGARGTHSSAPRWLARWLMAAPYLWSLLVQGQLRTVAHRLLGKR